MGPHANDGLGENIRVETIARAPVGDRLAAPGAYASGQTLEDPRSDFTRLAARMEHDPQQLSLVFGKADEGLGLGVHDVDRIGLVFGDGAQACFELDRSLLCQLSKQREFVFEVEIERAGGVSGLFGDGVARHGVRAKLGEEFATGGEEPTASRLGSRRAGTRAWRQSVASWVGRWIQVLTDGHVICDGNVSFAVG